VIRKFKQHCGFSNWFHVCGSRRHSRTKRLSIYRVEPFFKTPRPHNPSHETPFFSICRVEPFFKTPRPHETPAYRRTTTTPRATTNHHRRTTELHNSSFELPNFPQQTREPPMYPSTTNRPRCKFTTKSPTNTIHKKTSSFSPKTMVHPHELTLCERPPRGAQRGMYARGEPR